MVVCGEQAAAPDLLAQVLQSAQRNRSPVERTRAAPQFVNHSQAVHAPVPQNLRCLLQLDEERGLSLHHAVLSAHPGKYPVHRRQLTNCCTAHEIPPAP